MFHECAIVTAAAYIINHLCDYDSTYIGWKNMENITCKARPLHRWYINIFFIKTGMMGSIHRWNVWSFNNDIGMNQLYITIWDGGIFFSPLNFPVQVLKNHGKCISLNNVPQQNQYLHPPSPLVHLMQFNPLISVRSVLKEISLTFVYLAVELRDLGRTQLLVEHGFITKSSRTPLKKHWTSSITDSQLHSRMAKG